MPSPRTKKSAPDAIRLRGVRQNNLKDIDVDIPLGKFIAVTGLSGAGKSSLVFDTLHAEGQRRYVETFSAYTRQFLDLLEKPDLDSAENVRPSIAIEQKNTIKTSRSTVGTMTELTDFFKVWFSHVAALFDPETGEPIHDDNPKTIWEKTKATHPNKSLIIAFEVKKPEKLTWKEILKNVKAQGYSRLFLQEKPTNSPTLHRIDDLSVSSCTSWAENTKLNVVQDRIQIADTNKTRFLEAAETALEFGQGQLLILDKSGDILARHSRGLHSPSTGKTYRPASPPLFSFNSPIGACPKCRGFGRVIEIDYRLAIPDTTKSIEEGLIKPFEGQVYGESKNDLVRACKRAKISTTKPFNKLTQRQQDFVVLGEPKYRKLPQGTDSGGLWYGVKGFFDWLERNTYKMHVRIFLSRFRAYVPCPDCGATRLQPESLCWKWNDYRLPDLYEIPISDLQELIESQGRARRPGEPHQPDQSNKQADIAYDAILSRLRYLNHVGLGYLTLNRPARTLSGGEVERVNLTSCLGASLVDTLFVLDEPSVGLHARDIDRLIQIVRTLTDAGNTVVLVEHDDAMIQAADHVIEIGPEPGANGGQLVFQGTQAQLLKSKASITGQYLSGRQQIPVPTTTREVAPAVPSGHHTTREVGARLSRDSQSPQNLSAPSRAKNTRGLHITSASKHNIQDLDLSIPLQRFVCLSGVSGSGKSTLLNAVLYQNLIAQRGLLAEDPAALSSLKSDLDFEEIVLVDQSPVSRTPRSNPIVFVEAWDEIRKFYGKLPQSVENGYTASSFSFNAGDGRCEPCKGLGYEKIEMQFLSDVYVPCPHCNGKRFKAELLEIKHDSNSISDLLELTIAEVMELFKEYPKIHDKLAALDQVGLGYLKSGQPLNTLSGGESQRLKLVKYLQGRAGRPGTPQQPDQRKQKQAAPAGSLILLDEPTTGLHKHDVRRLLTVLQTIVDQGHSLIVIEHNIDVIKSADWLIEMGPEAGADGGQVVFQGTPETCAQTATTQTSQYLAPEFEGRAASPRPPQQPDHLLAAEAPTPYNTSLSDPSWAKNNTTSSTSLTVTGAREHNLRNINVSIPHYEFTVVTGASGSGKSTLAFDIVFGEGQRRFMESMSPYARQFVEQLPRPDLDQLSGIQPTVAIEQRVTRGSRKSTVATITEVAQYLRLLYSRLGVPHNPTTGNPLLSQTESELQKRLQTVVTSPETKKAKHLYLLAPLIRNRKGHHQPIANWIADHGYEMMRVDGKLIFTDDFKKLDRYKEHNIEVVIADLKTTVGSGLVPRSTTQINAYLKEALQRGKGTALIIPAPSSKNRAPNIQYLSTSKMDPETGEALPELDPKDFSFNSHKGWCPACRGHGRIYPWMRERLEDDEELAKAIGAEDTGDEDDSKAVICPECEGERLNRTSRHVYLYLKNGDKISLPQLLAQDPNQLLATLKKLKLDKRGQIIARDIIAQIHERLQFLDKVGLEYLSLDRPTQTLSGGEAQRIRLAAQLGSNLAGVLYVLDEPSIGLHARDGDRLIETLKNLKGKGNTLLVVEHDDATMEHADNIIDLGPGAGIHGGELIAQGTVAQLKKNKESLTGRYLKSGIPHPLQGQYRKVTKGRARRPGEPQQADHISLTNVTFRNLKKQSVHIPLNRLTMLCGASGAGKSSLVRDLLGPAAAHAIKTKKAKLTGQEFAKSGPSIEGNEGDVLFDTLTGATAFRSVIEVDQSPIGKTPRSTPATYLGVFDLIRQFFASLPESKMRGYKPGRFSFNTAHGRCDTCSGAGRVKLEMSFMPDTYVTCEDCGGSRYGPELLDLHWKGKNIADVLAMGFEEAAEFFSFHSQLGEIMQLMVETGLGYLTLGQSSPTLSGGEAQRLKLVTELAKGLQSYTERSRGIKRTNLYILEEPTIGLHLADCEKLIRLLHKLVEQGHTVVVIEHHLDLIQEADYVVELGPEGGPKGGKILYQGNLGGLKKSKRSITAPYLG
ncbi:excinuclease ABC subunit UvrA [Pelagicoccus mobilis]|uniref:UvrABC system protein A n=1 Tax=Pelagicoccus mobilis TaxID=415221 RepID=A0A934S0V8_9BACT|nr:excinuclease ABC subunit UvrA [Pelagicoccus mobilis]MBK1877404.1 ATP-binding cassette domain-containing protein [Pelagicoccus mobilis]